MDTICALSTPYGRSAIAVIRLSGPKARVIVEEMMGRSLSHRKVEYGLLIGSDGKLLDEVVAILFEGPNSYTGEDVVELSIHGNPKIVESILSQIVSRGTRLAEPGEFTRRALANQKISIDKVEALDVVLNSSTDEGISSGLRAKTEGLGQSVKEISDSLLDLRVRVESQLDFSEAEVGAYSVDEILGSLDSMLERLEIWAKAFDSYRHLFGRWVVALVGHPNSGKSSLFNALVGQNKAIVYDQPGTTRDYLTHELEIEGVPITLIDTAGIRDEPDAIEGLGIAKTFEVMKQSEAICWVDEKGSPPDDRIKAMYGDKKWILVGSKSDLAPPKSAVAIQVSAKLGSGIDKLREALVPKVDKSELEGQWAPLTSKRQYQQVIAGIQHLEQARAGIVEGRFLDAVAQEVRMASESISALVGPPSSDEVIRSIFTRFCIGK